MPKLSVAVKREGETLMVFENAAQTKEQIIVALETALKIVKGEGKANQGIILPYA